MGKNTHLINIYLKIYNKRTLTMDDLRYLAQYDPECFQKTCKNVVYNIPETKPIIEPKSTNTQLIEWKPQTPEAQSIQLILNNLKKLEADDYVVSNVDADSVKNLLGNLYMELLFPHNDKEIFINFTDNGNSSTFDKRA